MWVCRWPWNSPARVSRSPASTCSKHKVEQFNAGISYIQDVPTEVFRPYVEQGLFQRHHRFLSHRRTRHDQHRRADAAAQDQRSGHELSSSRPARRSPSTFTPGMLVILESTTYPGTTDELVLPMFEEAGLKVGEDFFLCFSPERVDPGNPNFQTDQYSQGGRRHHAGLHRDWARCSTRRRSKRWCRSVPRSVAEMVKLLENTFRMINIGLVNEMALMCDRMGINVWEVIDAAATKPFGFMPFYPGPGWAATAFRSIRSIFPGRPSRPASKRASSNWPATSTAHAAFCGRQDSERAERSHQAAEGLARSHCGRGLQARHRRCARIAGARLSCSSKSAAPRSPTAIPFVPVLKLDGNQLAAVDLMTAAAKADCVVIITDHKAFDYPALLNSADVIVDTRNAMKGLKSEKIVRL